MGERKTSNSKPHRPSWRVPMALKFLGRLKHRIKTKFSWEKFFRETDPADFMEPEAAPFLSHWYCPSTPAPEGLHGHEAQSSNPHSKYFDALDDSVYLDNFSLLHHPSYPELEAMYQTEQGPQWAGFSAGTAAMENYPGFDWDKTIDPATEIYYSGELFPDATTEVEFLQHNTDVGAVRDSHHANGSESMTTWNDLPPVPAEEHRSAAQHILDAGRLGSETFPRRRGRGLLEVVHIFRVVQAGRRFLNLVHVKKRRATGHFRTRLKRRTRPAKFQQPGMGSAGTLGFRGVYERNGRWVAEKRVSMAGKHKLWLGTFPSDTEAALAYDAAVFHCAAKKKQVENLNFPALRTHLEPSRYGEVLRLCRAGTAALKDQAKTLVKSLAAAHAARATLL